MPDEMDDSVRRLFEAERRIREAITDLQLGRAASFIFEDPGISTVWERFLSSGDPFLDDAREIIFRANEVLSGIAGMPNGPVKSLVVLEDLERLDKEYRAFAEAWGLPEKSCVSSLHISRTPSVALVANDVAHCLHNIANAIAARGNPEPVYAGDVYVQGVSPDEVEQILNFGVSPESPVDYYALICKEWSDAKRSFQYRAEDGAVPSAFEPQDVEATACYVTPAGAAIRLGNSPGHMAHVEIASPSERGVTVRVTYYDPDANVRKVLSKVLEDELSATCHDIEEDGKLVCEFEEYGGINNAPSHDTKALAASLAMMTSADFRVSRDQPLYASYFSFMKDQNPSHSRRFDEAFFKSLPEDQRVEAEVAFVKSAAKSFAESNWL